MNETLVITLAFVLFLAGILLFKLFKPKTRLIISTCCFIALIIVFAKNLVQHFSWLQLIIVSLFFITGIFGIYKRFKLLLAEK